VHLIYIKQGLRFELLRTCPCLQVHKNGPGDTLLNQKRGMDRSFVPASGFPGTDIKQEERKTAVMSMLLKIFFLLCVQILVLEAVQSKKDGW